MVMAVTLLLALGDPRPPVRPTLVVLLTVDQLRSDHLTRWQGQFRGGLGRLLEGGAFFPNGLQDHAVTQTAPGHASLLSGRFPSHTGIVSNGLGVPDSTVRLVGPADGGASPRRFVGTTLVDWLTATDSTTRFLSVSRKDRGAILPIGRARGPVFWLVEGRFTTSTWYADTLPAWVAAWNARGGPRRLAGKWWTPLLPDTAYKELDAPPWEHWGRDAAFPHQFPEDSAGVLQSVANYPWADSLTLDFALTGARALELGRGRRTDVLAISLSATDAVGHAYGPDSREVHDQLLRLDLWLGRFLDSLTTTVPPGRILLVLTADHGMTPYPELARSRGRPGGRIPISRLVREVNSELGPAGILQQTSGLIYADAARLRALRVSPESLATSLMARVLRLPGVAEAWTPATLGAPPANDVGAGRWRRSLPPDFSWLVCTVAAQGYIWSSTPGSADHGTGNFDDVNVPVLFHGAGISPGVRQDSVRTVDIAPTLARLLRIRPAERLDGRVIRSVAH